MVDPALLLQVKELDPADRLEVISELWQSIDADRLPVSDAERSMLDERLREAAGDPEAGQPWSEVEAALLRRVR